METSESRAQSIEKFDTTYGAYVRALEPLPDESLDFLIPGEDYALGGIAYHVNAVLVHYRNTFEAILADGLEETAPGDPPDLFETANAKAKHGLTPDQRGEVLAQTADLHGQVKRLAEGVDDEQFHTKTPVRYEAGADPYPTSAADILGWLSGHYEEHIPQIHQLHEAWKGGRDV